MASLCSEKVPEYVAFAERKTIFWNEGLGIHRQILGRESIHRRCINLQLVFAEQLIVKGSTGVGDLWRDRDVAAFPDRCRVCQEIDWSFGERTTYERVKIP